MALPGKQMVGSSPARAFESRFFHHISCRTFSPKLNWMSWRSPGRTGRRDQYNASLTQLDQSARILLERPPVQIGYEAPVQKLPNCSHPTPRAGRGFLPGTTSERTL